MNTPLLVATDLTRTYRDPVTRRFVRAVDGVSLAVPETGTLGILGASGAGKSSLTRLLLGLERPDRGVVLFEGIDLNHCAAHQLRTVRHRMQAVFQDPRSSLNPHLSVGTIVSEPLLAQGGLGRQARNQRIADALTMVGLPPSHVDRRPEELSGGERQRVAIARAIAPGPDLLVLDEPVSSLDGPIRVQVLHLLDGIRAKLGLAIVMVSHDVRSITTLTDRVMVMYAGRSIEEGPTADVVDNPQHPYTQSLLGAIPRRGSEPTLTIDPSSPAETGCACRTWCPLAEHRCQGQPELKERGSNHRVACWIR